MYLVGYIAIPRKIRVQLVKTIGKLIMERQLFVSVTRMLVNQKPSQQTPIRESSLLTHGTPSVNSRRNTDAICANYK